MARWRLYVDESGDHHYPKNGDPAVKYLGLTGVAIEQDYYADTFHPALEGLKQKHFRHHPDNPVILVRKRMVGREGPFGVLSDPAKNEAWGKDFLEFLKCLSPSKVELFTIVIDKEAHKDRYGDAAWHPYHYSMNVLVERYRGFLAYYHREGDIMAEARGKKEDTELQRAYNDLWNHGTNTMKAQLFHGVLTSKDLKFRRKEHNISGLQLADLLAAPMKLQVLAKYNALNGLPVSAYTTKMNQTTRRLNNMYGLRLLT